MNLRVRLTFLILALLVFGVGTTVQRSIVTARADVRNELQSTRLLVTRMVDLILNSGAAEAGLPLTSDIIERLAALSNVRHFDVDIVGAGNKISGNFEEQETQLRAPSWFVSLLDLQEEQFIGRYSDGNDGVILIRTDPTDEINTVWFATRSSIITSTVGILVFNLIIFVVLGYWLSPVKRITSGLESVVKGDYSHRIPKASLPELNSIIDQVNRLTGVLGATRVENERLAIQTLTIQEQERRGLAQELHDSLGQAVSAIKAMAVSINLRTMESDPMLAINARNIEKISDEAYHSVRNMMAWLRPAILDELGLKPALQQMVDDWNMHHEDSFCRLHIDGEFQDLSEHQRINLYRIMQETLTNIAKHARAEIVDVVLCGEEIISLQIRDDGLGFEPEKVGKGMGLSGIRNRVKSLQGRLELTTAPGKGTTMQFEFPRRLGNDVVSRKATEAGSNAPAKKT